MLKQKGKKFTLTTRVINENYQLKTMVASYVYIKNDAYICTYIYTNNG